MTCAGVLALCVAHGYANEIAKGKLVRDPARDPNLRTALLALGTTIDHPVSKKPGNQPIPEVTNGGFYYFLWSLERVAMVLGLDTIGGKDWYGWGAEILLRSQRPDGSWEGNYGLGGADTSFALLFLVRANLARDLSAALRGKIQDPGEVVLRAGGVDGSNLQTPRLKPALEPAHKPPIGGSQPTVRDPKDKPAPPVTGLDAEAARLSARLVEAKGERQNEMLTQLREGKGVIYTQALAAAIPQLGGEVRSRAREALAERLTRMNAATLADKLEDESSEVRRAAALAIAMKDDRTHLRKLIDLLQDPEPVVARAAHAALKTLTRQDFGPGPDAAPADRDRAIAAWKAWLARQPAR
jgi:hypothetical protein